MCALVNVSLNISHGAAIIMRSTAMLTHVHLVVSSCASVHHCACALHPDSTIEHVGTPGASQSPSLASSDTLLPHTPLQALLEFVVKRRQAAKAAAAASSSATSGRSSSLLQEHPEFLAPYLVYLLAHHPDCPVAGPGAEQEVQDSWAPFQVRGWACLALACLHTCASALHSLAM
jgi:hypothetical protein